MSDSQRFTPTQPLAQQTNSPSVGPSATPTEIGPETSVQGVGAIGRLNEAEREALVQAFYTAEDFPTEPVDTNGWPWDDYGPSWYALAHAQAAKIQHAVERIVREHTDRALAEVEQRIDESIADLPEGREEWAHGAITALRNVQRHVRAARQEQGR